MADTAVSTVQMSRSRSGGRGLYLATFLVVVVGAIGYAVLSGAGGASAGESTETYTVATRSFPVVLNEKGELKAKDSVQVKCEVEGRSTIIWLIPEGTQVKKGDLLVKLASNEIAERVRAEQIKVQNSEAAAEAADKDLEILLDQNASDIRKAELALRNAEIELTKYLEGDYVQQLTEAQLALDKAKKTLANKQQILEDSKRLLEKDYITQREYDNAEFDAYASKVNVETTQLALEILKKYTHPQAKEQKESDVAEERQDLERARKRCAAKEAQQRANTAARRAEFELNSGRLEKLLTQQKKTEIYAPADGLVVYDPGRNRWDPRQIAEGSEVYERQTIIQLPDTSVMQVKLRVHEAKTDKIAVGQPASVEVEGFPGVTLTGKVTNIAPLADSQMSWINPDMKEYDTEITLDKNEYDLKPGVTARAEIMVEMVEDVLAVPVQAVYSVGSRNFVFVGDSQESAEPTEVQIGVTSDIYAGVESGISEGDRVVLAAGDSLLARLPDEIDPAQQSAAKFAEVAKADSSSKDKTKTTKEESPKSKPLDNAKTATAVKP